MADFDQYFPQLLRFEGGYVDNPYDPGGATNLGITLQTFQTCAQRLLDVQPTLADLRALTDPQAATLYKALYWDSIHGDAIATQEIADIVFDFKVNAGYHAVLLLQQVLGPPLAIDGQFGPVTLAALAQADQAGVYARYRQGRIDYYRTLATQHPTLRRFLPGWLNRAQWFPAQLPA